MHVPWLEHNKRTRPHTVGVHTCATGPGGPPLVAVGTHAGPRAACQHS